MHSGEHGRLHGGEPRFRLVSQYRWDEVADLPRDGSVQLIDIRTPAEFERGALPGFRNIPWMSCASGQASWIPRCPCALPAKAACAATQPPACWRAMGSPT